MPVPKFNGSKTRWRRCGARSNSTASGPQEIGELIARYTSDIAAAESKRSEQATQLQEADALIARTNQLLLSKEREVEQLMEALQAARQERTSKDEELQALQLSFSKLEGRITSLQGDLAGHDSAPGSDCPPPR